MHSNHRQDIDKVYAGDIAAAVGLKEVSTGDTLCDPDHPVILESMEFPEPVIDIAIEPKDKANSEKNGNCFSKNLLKKIQHSKHIQIKKQVKLLLLVW